MSSGSVFWNEWGTEFIFKIFRKINHLYDVFLTLKNVLEKTKWNNKNQNKIL